MNREISPVVAAVVIAAVVVLVVVVAYFGLFRRPQPVGGRPVAGSGPMTAPMGAGAPMPGPGNMGAYGGSAGRPMRGGLATGGMPSGGY